MSVAGHTSAAATHTPAVHTGITTAAWKGTAVATGQGIRWIRWLVAINLGLVALQPISAGLFLSGYGRATAVHAGVALALQLGAFIQAVTALVLWRRRRVPGWLARTSIGLFVIVFLQAGLGYNKQYWLHVPIGVGIFGWLTRLKIRLDILSQATGARS